MILSSLGRQVADASPTCGNPPGYGVKELRVQADDGLAGADADGAGVAAPAVLLVVAAVAAAAILGSRRV